VNEPDEGVVVLFEDPLPPVLNVATPERFTPRIVVWKVPSFGKNVPLLKGFPFPPPIAMASGDAAMKIDATKTSAAGERKNDGLEIEVRERCFIG